MFMQHQRMYLDYASSTPVDPRVFEAMRPFFAETFGNPNAFHDEGTDAREALEHARDAVAHGLDTHPDEIIFTSGGTESNALAIFGLLRALEESGTPLSAMHLVTSVIEHPSVLDCFKYLEDKGARVSYIPVTGDGVLDLAAFEQSLCPETTLVSCMLVNNEIGTIQPVAEIAEIIRKHRVSGRTLSVPFFHTDASQAPLFIKVSATALGVDLLTLDAQKLYGPKGVGALFVRHGVSLAALFVGGKQERRLRPGTQNVPAIVGFARALEIAEEQRSEDTRRVTELRDYFIDTLLKKIPGTVLNGSKTERIANNVNISIPGTTNELLVLRLNARGIACAARSACLGQGAEGSYVVAALTNERSNTAVRFTLGRETTKEIIDSVVSITAEEAAV